MALSRMNCIRMCIGIITCAAVLSYGTFWHSWLIRSSTSVRRLFWFDSNRTCLEDLLFDFGLTATDVKTSSGPIYVRLSSPLSVTPACSNHLQLNWTRIPPPRNISKLQNLIRPDQQARLPDILHNLVENFTQRRLELFMAGGSLLGSVRHFGFFPWDADIDVMILSRQKTQVRRLLIELSAMDEFRFADTERINGHWQLGIFCQRIANKPAKPRYGNKNHLYPEKECPTIVDFFFGWHGEHIYRRQEHPGVFPESDVYPLTLRPFGPYLIPSPRNAENFLSAVYGKDYETRCYYKYFKSRSFDCAALRSVVSFVSHLDLGIRLDVQVFKSDMLALFIPQQ